MNTLDKLKNAFAASWKSLLSADVPLVYKLIPFAAVVYVITPVDIIPEITFPVVGVVDDVTVILSSLYIFQWLCGMKIEEPKTKKHVAGDVEEAEVADKS